MSNKNGNGKIRRRRANFEHLRIWQEAHQLMLIVHGIANKLPFREKTSSDQIKRSSSSVPDNIAESTGAYYFKDKLKSLYVSRKEAVETQNHLIGLAAKQLLTHHRKDELVDRYQGLVIGINRYIGKINVTMRDYVKVSRQSYSSLMSK